MKRLWLLIGLVLLPTLVHAQSTSNFWTLLGSKIKPIINTYRVDSPGGFSGRTLTISSLKNCASLATDGSGITSCGSGSGGSGGGTGLAWSNTGALQAAFDTRFINQSGDTMTGALFIDVRNGGLGTLGLKVINTLSGAIIHAEVALTSSGNLNIWGNSSVRNRMSGAILVVSRSASITGSLSITQKAAAGSGAMTLVQTRNSTGAFMRSSATGAALLVLEARGGFRAPHILFGGSGSFDVSLRRSATGVLTVQGNLSGFNLTVSRSASISGTLVVRGNLSTKSTLSGRTLNIMAGNTSYIQGLLAVRKTTLTSGFALEVNGAASGSIMHVERTFTSSGLIVIVPRTMYGSGGIVLRQTRNATGAYLRSTATGAPLLVLEGRGSRLSPHILLGGSGSFDVGLRRSGTGVLTIDGTLSGSKLVMSSSVSFSGALIVRSAITSKGSLSGSTFYGANLGECSASTQKVTYSVATGKFSCGTDQGGGLTFTSKTTDYTAAASDYVLADVTAGSWTLTLPAASANAQIGAQLVKNNNTGSKTVTIKAPSASNIILKTWNGTGGVTLTGSLVLYDTGASVTMQSDGTNWYTTVGNTLKHVAMLRAVTAQAITGTQKVTIPATKMNVGQIADPINSQIKIRRSGLYSIRAFCSLASAGLSCEIYKNGALFHLHGQSDYGNGEVMISAEVVTYLTKGDYIELYIQNQILGSANTIVNEGRNPHLIVQEL